MWGEANDLYLNTGAARRVNTMADEVEHSNLAAGDSPADGTRSIAFGENRLDSRDLFAGTREITIVHGGDIYRLRLTAQNKLILTK